jgi:hypothetical protein
LFIYRFRLSCYTHCNSLRAGIVSRLADHKWSSYRYWARGKKDFPNLLVSCLVRLRQRCGFLEEALTSLENQEMPKFKNEAEKRLPGENTILQNILNGLIQKIKYHTYME